MESCLSPSHQWREGPASGQGAVEGPGPEGLGTQGFSRLVSLRLWLQPQSPTREGSSPAVCPTLLPELELSLWLVRLSLCFEEGLSVPS